MEDASFEFVAINVVLCMCCVKTLLIPVFLYSWFKSTVKTAFRASYFVKASQIAVLLLNVLLWLLQKSHQFCFLARKNNCLLAADILLFCRLEVFAQVYYSKKIFSILMLYYQTSLLLLNSSFAESIVFVVTNHLFYFCFFHSAYHFFLFWCCHKNGRWYFWCISRFFFKKSWSIYNDTPEKKCQWRTRSVLELNDWTFDALVIAKRNEAGSEKPGGVICARHSTTSFKANLAKS